VAKSNKKRKQKTVSQKVVNMGTSGILMPKVARDFLGHRIIASLIMLAGGLEKATSGKIFFEDQEISKMSEDEILKTIELVYKKFNVVLDPHSAIGYGAFDKVNISGNNIVLATAHPCKFPDAIKNAIDLNAELPKELMYILDEKENYKIIDNNVDEVKKHIKERI